MDHKKTTCSSGHAGHCASLEHNHVCVIPTIRDPLGSHMHHTINPFYSLDNLLHDIAATPPSLATGYTTLDAFWKIPTEALTIIAGRPSHGKTALLVNLFLNLIQKNPHSTFLFCSYEVTKKHLLLNILNNICKVELNEQFNSEYLSSYLLKHHELIKTLSHDTVHKLEYGKQNLNRLVRDNRLAIIDDRLYIDELVGFLAAFKQEYNVGAIFIDYMQKIKIKGRYQSRQTELQKISEYLLEAALKFSLPIILGAQFNREVSTKKDMDESRLREAGDIEQDAHSILGLWNESKAHSQSINQAAQPTIDIVVLKNRNGKTGGEVTLYFNGATFTLSETYDKTVQDPLQRNFY